MLCQWIVGTNSVFASEVSLPSWRKTLSKTSVKKKPTAISDCRFLLATRNATNFYLQRDFKNCQIAQIRRRGSKNLLEPMMAKKEYLPQPNLDQLESNLPSFSWVAFHCTLATEDMTRRALQSSRSFL